MNLRFPDWAGEISTRFAAGIMGVLFLIIVDETLLPRGRAPHSGLASHKKKAGGEPEGRRLSFGP